LNKVENTSGRGKDSMVPFPVRGWNWGAFFLNVIWSIGNRTWIGLLCLVPVVGLIMPIVLGFRGNEWAWRNKRWESVAHFKRIQKKWAMFGVVVALCVVVTPNVLFFYAFQTGDPYTGEHLSSVDWLPESATDVSFYRIDGFGWVKNYDCLIPEIDFRVFAAENGWKLQTEDSILYYAKRHRNGGGVSVNYNRETGRLSVQSNHR